MSFKLADAFVEVRGNASRLGADLAKMQSIVAQGVGKITGTISSAFSRLSSATLLAGGGVAAGVIGAVKEFAKWEKTVRSLEFVMDGATDKLDGYKQAIMTLSRQSGQGFEDIAAALNEVVSSGLALEHAMDITTASVKAAVGAGDDLRRVNAGVVSVMLTYKLSADQATAVTDSMIAAAKVARASLSEMSEALARVAPRASQMGIGLAEVEATIATLTQAGLRLNDATELTGRLMEQLYTAQQMVAKGQKRLSFDISAERIAREGLAAVIQDLMATEDEELRQMVQSFTGYRALNTLVDNAATYRENLTQVTRAGGRTEAEYARSLETTESKFRRITQAVKAGMVRVGEIVISGWNYVSEAWGAIWDSLGKRVVDFFRTTLGKSASFLGSWEDFTKWAGEAWEEFLLVLGTADLYVDQVALMLVKWWDDLSGWFTSQWEVFSRTWQDTWVSIVDIAKRAMASVQFEFTDWVESFRELWAIIKGGLGLLSSEEVDKILVRSYRKVEAAQQALATKKTAIEQSTGDKRKAVWEGFGQAGQGGMTDAQYYDALIEIDRRIAERRAHLKQKRQQKSSKDPTWTDVSDAVAGSKGAAAVGAIASSVRGAVSQLLAPTAVTGMRRLAIAPAAIADVATRQREKVIKELKLTREEIVSKLVSMAGWFLP